MNLNLQIFLRTLGTSFCIALFVSIFFLFKVDNGSALVHFVKDLQLDKIKYFPWTDVAENIAIGFLMSKGYVLYDYVVMNHMQGIPALISLVPHLTSDVFAGPDTFKSLFAISIFLSVFVQSVLILGSNVLLMRMSFLPSLIFTFALVAFYGVVFDAAVLMSESVTMALVYVGVSHLIKIILFTNIGIADFALALALVLLSISIGLTSFIFWPLYIAFIFVFMLLCKIEFEFRSDYSVFCLFSFVFLLISITAYPLFESRFDNVYFWNVSFNSIVNRPNILLNLKHLMEAALVVFPGGLSSFFLLNPSLLVYISLIGIGIYFCKRAKLERRIEIAFMFFLIVSYVSFHWRFLTGYKTLPVIGCFSPLIAYISSSALLVYKISKRRLAIFFTLLSLPALLNYKSIVKFDRDPQVSSLESFGLCTQDLPSDNCRCLVSDTWGPQFFAVNNVAPCQGYFPSLPPPFFDVPELKDRFMRDMRNGAIVVNVHSESFTPFLQSDVRSLYSGAKCEQFSPVSKLCHY